MTRDERIEGIARALVELWRRGQLPGADALLEAMDSALAPDPTPSPADQEGSPSKENAP